jgi:hypothetical protein
MKTSQRFQISNLEFDDLKSNNLKFLLELLMIICPKTLTELRCNCGRMLESNLKSEIGNRRRRILPMAKRKPTKKPSGRVPRKEPYSGQRVEVVVERVREQAAKLSALSRTMQDARLDHVVIDGHAMLLRGLNQIDNFIDNASRAVREAKVAKEGF